MGNRSLRLWATLGVAVVAAGCVTASAAGSDRFVGDSFSVLAPGSVNSLPVGVNSVDQIALYDGLTPLRGSVSEADLEKYFKPSVFGSKAMPGKVEATGHKGLKVVRDDYGVPHVFGEDREDVMFGAGWVTAHDRGLLINALRQAGRLAALDVPSFNPKDLGKLQGEVALTSEAKVRLLGQLKLLRKQEGGEIVEADLKAYVAGINAYFRKTKAKVAPWSAIDVIASSSMVGALFGSNGGSEVRDAAFLDALQNSLGKTKGKAIWNDLTRGQDPEATTTAKGYFPYQQVPKGKLTGSVVVDSGSQDQAAKAAARVQQAKNSSMSNAIVVGASRSTTGHPLAIMGPQAAYFYPAVVMEMDLHGGGIDTRGVAFAGSGPYVMLGRGKDFAWSATTSEGDTEDQYLEELCSPGGGKVTRNSRHYRYRGKCTAMDYFDVGTQTVAGKKQRVAFWKTVHGPVSGTTKADGKLYAIATKRSTAGREILNGLAFAQLNSNRIRTPAQFIDTMVTKSEMTLNWYYLDSKNIGYVSAGRYPRRAKDVHPNLPTLGDGSHEWQGYLSPAEHPHVINPKDGALINWNNQPAPGFNSSDNLFSYRSVQRVDLLTDLKPKNSLADIVGVMNKAATEDLRATKVWPTIRRVLGDNANAPDARTAAAADLIDQWAADGASRLDLDNDGKIDAPGAAVIDRVWPALGDAIFKRVLNADNLERFKGLGAADDAPSPLGSAFEKGWYGLISKDLRTILGDKVNGPYSRTYCGDGDLSTCRSDLWNALKVAADELAAAQGEDPNAWRSSATDERLKFEPGLIPQTMRWANRPTFQQVIEFKSHR